MCLTYEIVKWKVYWLEVLRVYHYSIPFDFGSVRMFSTAKFKTYFSYQKVIWIDATDYNVHFYLIALSHIYSYILLQLINRSVNKFYTFITFSFQINAFILPLNCLVYVLSLHILSFVLFLLHLCIIYAICSEIFLVFVHFHVFYIS